MKSLSVIVLAASAWCLGASGASGDTLDLKGAIRFALDHAPSLQGAKARAEVASLQAGNQGAAFLPSLDLVSSHGYLSGSPRATSTPWTSFTSLQLTETLWDNGETLTKWRIARLAEERADLDWRLAREKAVLDVSQEFFRYSLAEALAVVQAEQLTLLRKQHDLMEQQYRGGVKTREDYTRAQAQLQSAELERLKAANEVEKSRRELMRILGVGLDDPASSWKFSALEPKPLEARDEPASPPSAKGTLAYRANQIQRKENDLTVSLTSRKWWPQLSLTGSAGYELNGYLGTGTALKDTDKFSYGAALTLKFNLWDWGVRRRDTEIAERNNFALDRDLTAREQSDRAAIETLWLELGRSKRSFALSQELLKLQKANFAALETDYRKGVVRYLDLITGLRDLATAKSGYLGSYFDYRQNLTLHRYYEGKLYETTMAD